MKMSLYSIMNDSLIQLFDFGELITFKHADIILRVVAILLGKTLYAHP